MDRTISKGWAVAVVVVLIVFGMSSQAHAGTQVKDPAQKFSRGITHSVTAIFQIPRNIIQTAAETEPTWLGPWKGMTVGAGQGAFHSGRQAVSGLYDMFTFWTPAGTDWEPLFEAESLFPEI